MNDFTVDDILDRIRVLRMLNGLSAYDLCVELRLPSDYFTQVKNGRIQMSIDIFLQILKVLDVSVYRFFVKENFIDNYKK